ncbi:MAG TPA: NAD(P)/FAD-dependent oxidoreductase [Pseudoxanthomonas sp.]
MPERDDGLDTTSLMDVAIVGGGPAGLTAATYLRRFHRSCLVLHDGDSRARWIPESNNCPGFPHGVLGVELLRRMKEQAVGFGTRFEEALIDAIELHEEGFVLSAQERRWRARCVILATGLCDKLPDAPWVEAAVACGAMRLCSICDAYEASDTRIGVYGPGGVIGAHGLFLRSYSEQVFLLPTDGDEEGLVEARAAGIRVLAAGGALDFDGERCTYLAAGGSATVFDSVYPFLGAYTTAGIAARVGAALSETGELVVDAQQMTNVPNLFAIGDVVSGLNQISVAVGQAAIAATCAHRRLPFVPRS